MTVLIIADQPEFSRDLMGRWQSERSVPAFTVVNSNVWQENAGDFDLAVVGPLPMPELLPLVAQLEAKGAPVVCAVEDNAAAKALREHHGRALALRKTEGWLDLLVLFAAEVLRRVEVAARARRAEEKLVTAERHATLGRYMLEMRHNLNNALTSVLGHSELLLLQPGELTAEVRDQLEVIRSMALRMHEVLQRFSSLDAEMQFAERQSHTETQKPAKAWSRGA